MTFVLPLEAYVVASDSIRIGDKVQVRDTLDDEWKDGVVAEIELEGFLRIVPDGWDTHFRWKYCMDAAGVSVPSKASSFALDMRIPASDAVSAALKASPFAALPSVPIITELTENITLPHLSPPKSSGPEIAEALARSDFVKDFEDVYSSGSYSSSEGSEEEERSSLLLWSRQAERSEDSEERSSCSRHDRSSSSSSCSNSALPLRGNPQVSGVDSLSHPPGMAPAARTLRIALLRKLFDKIPAYRNHEHLFISSSAESAVSSFDIQDSRGTGCTSPFDIQDRRGTSSSAKSVEEVRHALGDAKRWERLDAVRREQAKRASELFRDAQERFSVKTGSKRPRSQQQRNSTSKQAPVGSFANAAHTPGDGRVLKRLQGRSRERPRFERQSSAAPFRQPLQDVELRPPAKRHVADGERSRSRDSRRSLERRDTGRGIGPTKEDDDRKYAGAFPKSRPPNKSSKVTNAVLCTEEPGQEFKKEIQVRLAPRSGASQHGTVGHENGVAMPMGVKHRGSADGKKRKNKERGSADGREFLSEHASMSWTFLNDGRSRPVLRLEWIGPVEGSTVLNSWYDLLSACAQPDRCIFTDISACEGLVEFDSTKAVGVHEDRGPRMRASFLAMAISLAFKARTTQQFQQVPAAMKTLVQMADRAERLALRG